MSAMKGGDCDKWLQVRGIKRRSMEGVGIKTDEKCKFKEAERAEKLFHLICWGPNK